VEEGHVDVGKKERKEERGEREERERVKKRETERGGG